MDDVDRSFVIGRALGVAGEVSKISACSENRSHSGDLCNGVSVLQAFKSFNHQDQHDIVINSVAITARNIAPHCGIECLAASIAAFSQRRKVSPVSRFDRFLEGIHRGYNHNEGASVDRMLDFAFVRVRNADAWNSFRRRTGAPHAGNGAPIALIVLHLGPDKVVTRVCHRTIDRRIRGVEERTAGDFAALHHLELNGIPDLRSLWGVPGLAVLPGRRIKRALVDGARRGHIARIAVFACGRGERELCRSRSRVIVVGVRISGRLRSIFCLKTKRG